MKKKFSEMPTPLNANERFLFGIGERLEALLDAIEAIGTVQEVTKPILDEKVEEAKPAVKRTRKAPTKTASPKEE